MKSRRLQTPGCRAAKAISKKVADLIATIQRYSDEPAAFGLASDCAAFLPVLDMLQDVVEARVPLDRPALAEWTSALAVMETEDEWEDDPA